MEAQSCGSGNRRCDAEGRDQKQGWLKNDSKERVVQDGKTIRGTPSAFISDRAGDMVGIKASLTWECTHCTYCNYEEPWLDETSTIQMKEH